MRAIIPPYLLARIASVPFVDYARGDGLTVGPGQQVEWSPIVIGDEDGWVDGYRGLWGLDTGDRMAGERAPAGPKYTRDGTVRQSWNDPLSFVGLAGSPTPGETRQALVDQVAALSAERADHRTHVKEQGEPDAAEGDGVGAGKDLTINRDRKQELEGWREELEHPDGRIGQTPRGRGETEQGHGRDDSGGHEQAGLAPTGAEEGAAFRAAKQQPAQRERKEDDRLDRQPGKRIDCDHLPQQAVGREAEAEGEAEPQGSERSCRKDCNAPAGDGYRCPLDGREAFLEDEPAKQDVGKRIEVIAEAAREDVPAVDGVDVEQPVGSDEKGRQEQRCQRAAA